MNAAQDPRDIALAAHRNYYEAGTYDDDRLRWTINEFLCNQQPVKMLEVGCGDGAMLKLLIAQGIDAQGVDASSSGVERCASAGLRAQCLDVSVDGLPFGDNEFDMVLSLETLEHLMNPYYALQEVRRVLNPGGRFLCSVPNPRTGHPYLYPGLFDYANFRRFLEQSGFTIGRVAPWQKVEREMILPAALRKMPVVRSRIVAGGIRRIIEKLYLAAGVFPFFCYWLWTFDCRNQKSKRAQMFREISEQTRPGSERRVKGGG